VALEKHPPKRVAGLETLDKRLIDGLTFCRRAYTVFDRIRSARGGVNELRLLQSQRAKKLVEEILPLVAYTQARYGPALRFKIEWFGGNQPFDARQVSTGDHVEDGAVPRELFIEVTTAVHPNEHLVRERVSKEGASFSARGTRRDRKTNEIVSVPTVYHNYEAHDELVSLIQARVADKASKVYGQNTLLLVCCVVGMPVLDDEWQYIVNALREKPAAHQFHEVVLVEPVGRRVTSLYGPRREDTK
jgi:hypothetical protein